jgi:hypothetical protein
VVSIGPARVGAEMSLFWECVTTYLGISARNSRKFKEVQRAHYYYLLFVKMDRIK